MPRSAILGRAVSVAGVGGHVYRRAMDVILIPGFWLDASSWAPVSAALAAAGHAPHPVTPLGAGGAADEVAGITLADQAAAVVELLDGLELDEDSRALLRDFIAQRR